MPTVPDALFGPKVNQSQYLERHYDRRMARMRINDKLAQRVGFSDVDVPAIAIYQSSFGRCLLLPRVRSLVEARDGFRSLEMRLLWAASRRREVEPESHVTEQMELFA